MANQATNTEHSGGKNRGTGYYGKRANAKRESNKARRAAAKKNSSGFLVIVFRYGSTISSSTRKPNRGDGRL